MRDIYQRHSNNQMSKLVAQNNCNPPCDCSMHKSMKSSSTKVAHLFQLMAKFDDPGTSGASHATGLDPKRHMEVEAQTDLTEIARCLCHHGSSEARSFALGKHKMTTVLADQIRVHDNAFKMSNLFNQFSNKLGGRNHQPKNTNFHRKGHKTLKPSPPSSVGWLWRPLSSSARASACSSACGVLRSCLLGWINIEQIT